VATPAPNPQDASQADRKRRFSATQAVLREDPHDVRARLQMVDLLQQEGRLDEAVEELLRVAAVYTTRGVPIKAVAVLRQAVKLQPERADVRVAYGEVFEKLRMVDDAVRELTQACEMYHQVGDAGHELDAVARLVLLDKSNLTAHLKVAEALSRAGRRDQAAAIFRQLAGRLLESGETGDWERVSERVIFHDPRDVTTAHDLALHYVRSGRYPEALSKLIICYESEPNDVELLELIIETLAYLGQRDRAAALNRQLIARYQRSGLKKEAEAALERQHGLDPDDADAKRAMGVMATTVQADTVIELEAGEGLAIVEPAPAAELDRFEGDFIDELMAGDEAPDEDDLLGDDAPTVALDVVGDHMLSGGTAAETHASAADQPPPLADGGEFGGSSDLPPRLDQESDGFDAYSSLDPDAPGRPLAPPTPMPRRRASAPPRPMAATRQSGPPVSRKSLATTSRERPSVRRPSLSPGGQAEPVRDRPARRTTAQSPSPEMELGALDASTMPLIPIPTRRAPGSSKRSTGSFGRSRQQPKPRAPTSTESVHSWVLDEEETGFDGAEDRTMIDADVLAMVRSTDVPALESDAQPAARRAPARRAAPAQKSQRHSAPNRLPTGPRQRPSSPNQAEKGPVENVAKIAGRAPPAPRAGNEVVATSPERGSGPRRLKTRRRSANLPRPRLTRSGTARSERSPTSSRGISADLKTLDFFIERGFTESALALLAELERRHPNNDELRLRRQRIAAMPR